MKIEVVFSLIVVAGVAALTHSHNPVVELAMGYYCGRELTKALALACPDGLPAKRSGGEALTWQGMPWVPAHAVVRTLGRARRGVLNECCFKPCDMNELTAYCAPH